MPCNVEYGEKWIENRVKQLWSLNYEMAKKWLNKYLQPRNATRFDARLILKYFKPYININRCLLGSTSDRIQ